MKDTIIIDYGAGNVKSIYNALKFLGYESILTNNIDDIKNAKRVILPGVGAFGKAMEQIKDLELIDTLKNHCDQNKPFLGICLGMQMMFKYSEEFGKYEGLDIIDGHVEKLPENQTNKKYYRIPNIGWYETKNKNDFNVSYDENLFYHVHSYHCIPKNKNEIILTTMFNELEIVVGVKKNKTLGFQFHPEKSRKQGLKLLKYFCDLN